MWAGTAFPFTVSLAGISGIDGVVPRGRFPFPAQWEWPFPQSLSEGSGGGAPVRVLTVRSPFQSVRGVLTERQILLAVVTMDIYQHVLPDLQEHAAAVKPGTFPLGLVPLTCTRRHGSDVKYSVRSLLPKPNS